MSENMFSSFIIEFLSEDVRDTVLGKFGVGVGACVVYLLFVLRMDRGCLVDLVCC